MYENKKAKPVLKIDSNQGWNVGTRDPYQLDFHRNSAYKTDELFIIVIVDNRDVIWDSIPYYKYSTVYLLYQRIRDRNSLPRCSYIKIDKYEYDEYQMKNYYLRDILRYTNPNIIQVKFYT